MLGIYIEWRGQGVLRTHIVGSRHSAHRWSEEFCFLVLHINLLWYTLQSGTSEKYDTSLMDLYACPLCQVYMETASGLQRHLLAHVRNQCKVCLQLFPTKKNLSAHMRGTHNTCIPDTVYICRFCQRRFSKTTALYLHLKCHTKGEEQVCLKCDFLTATMTSYNQHMHAHALHAQFTCNKCTHTFDRRQQYNAHLKCHQKWDCSMCENKHSHRRDFEQHCRKAHGLKLVDNRTFSCLYCPTSAETFASRYRLRLHLAEKHTEARPYVCRHCKLSFLDKKKLLKHQATETHLFKSGILVRPDESGAPKWLSCEQCGLTFARKEHLDRHSKVHNETKPFQCSMCSFSCKEKANLKNHEKRHTSEREFVCSICGSSFQTKKTLEDHNIYVHSDVRNHLCDTCPAAFKSKKDLLRHRRSVHANMKPHVCKVCNSGMDAV
jgi:KRAB domain-containing zinc finger protein